LDEHNFDPERDPGCSNNFLSGNAILRGSCVSWLVDDFRRHVRICLDSEAEPILQLVDVVLGAFTALRNNRALIGAKREVADHALKALQKRRHDLFAMHSGTRHFSVWNVNPKKLLECALIHHQACTIPVDRCVTFMTDNDEWPLGNSVA
jgi:hypothetical protein